MKDLTETQVDRFLAQLGNYRVRRVQTVCNEGQPDGISGSLFLALGLRETLLQNIEGGAKLDIATGKWVAQDDPELMDVGVFQISRKFHIRDLELMLGVQDGTWAPVIGNRNAGDSGFVPRFEEALQYTLREFHENMAQLEEHVPVRDLVQVAVAAHNAGVAGALHGYNMKDIDINTAGGDYSVWVLRHRTMVNHWLGQHPKWIV